MKRSYATPVLLLILLQPNAWAQSQYALDLGLENRYYQSEGEFGNIDQSEISLRLQFDYSYSWDNSRKLIQFIPYALVSDPDREKSHTDLREASFSASFGRLELQVGISKLFWGVTESTHLVDVINQTDLVENPDGEDKLGQPLIALGVATEWGCLTGFVLPYFRERSFPGVDGRLRTALIVDTDNPTFESADEERHIDLAIRWEHSVSYFDIGLSYFDGTSRDPILMPGSISGGDSVLIPQYPQISQTGVDLQMTYEALLLKHESIYRNYDSAEHEDFYAQASGLEYSLYSVLDSPADLGLILEYLSADDANNARTPFDKHSFVALRLVFNDTQDSSVLAGMVFDHDSDTRFVNIEVSRRLAPELTGTLEIRHFEIDDEDTSALSSYARESYVQVEMIYAF